MRTSPFVVRLIGVATVACLYAGLVTVATRSAFDTGNRAGSTVASGVGGAGGAGREGGSGVGTSVATPTSAVSADAPTGTGPGTDSAPPVIGSTGGGTAGGARPGGTTAGTAATEPAVSAGAISIGVHDDDPGAAFAQYGVKGASGDQGQWIDAIVKWINEHGGMGGRRVQLVHHVTQSLNGSFDEQAQRACSFFTEDNHVAAVVGGARVPTLNLVDCLAKHRTPLVWSYHFMARQATFDQYADYLYMPNMVAADRLGVWMDALADSGFFKGATIGVVRYDDRTHEFFSSSVLRPALARHGLAIKDEVAFRPGTGAASAADLSAQANNAILRFRSEGIDRVVFVPTSAVVPLLFLASAESQSYRPRYTMASYDNLAFQNDNAKGTSQLHGAVGFGWLPAGDVAWEQQPKPLPPQAQLCVDITKGADPPGNSSVRRFCDGLFFLKYLLDHGAEPTPAGLRAAIESLGTSYPSAWTPATRLGPGRHDGAAVARLVPYDDACRCFTIAGPDIPIP